MFVEFNQANSTIKTAPNCKIFILCKEGKTLMLYDFGPRLLKLRKDKNLTQQMVVERAKGFDPNLRLSDSVLGKYESDLAVPRLTEAAVLADVLNVSLDYLTSGEKCNVLSLKELSPEQVQLLMDLTAYIRTKKRRSQGHKNAPKPTTEETELITRLIAEILY
jgi:transcriptional regulator with XRE-family HTH domain